MTREGPSLPNAREVAVVFLFPDSSEIRYLTNPPAAGARVRSSTGERFVVAKIFASGERVFTAHCIVQTAVAPTRTAARPEASPVRVEEPGHPGGVDDFASHLLARVRRTLDAPARLRRRYQMRHYIP